MQDIYDFLWFCSCILLAAFIFRDKSNDTPPLQSASQSVSPQSIINSQPTLSSRIQQIDGLRYILAALVAYHHSGFVYNLLVSNKWNITSKLMIHSGHIGVALFFIISGYLFANLKPNSDWIAFFIKRMCRIFPIFTISALCCVLIASYIGYSTGKPMNYNGLFEWFNMGFKNDRPAIWGYQFTHLINSGVMWTLEWEWAFYFTVPMISILVPNNQRFVFATFMIFLSSYVFVRFDYSRAVYIMLFSLGFCIRHIPKIKVFNFYKKNRISIECILILMFLCFLSLPYRHYSIGSTVFFGIFFLFIAVGANFFGLLTTSGFVKLGDASYSIYLLHGIFWFIMFKVLLHFDLLDNLYILYSVKTITWLLICFVSLKTYKYIEAPAIRFGKRFSFINKENIV